MTDTRAQHKPVGEAYFLHTGQDVDTQNIASWNRADCEQPPNDRPVLLPPVGTWLADLVKYLEYPHEND